jgi:thiol-disulfide isomerase/thioredoxin
MFKRFILIFSVIFWINTYHVNAVLPEGNWHAAIKINDTLELPFTFITEKNKIIIRNGEEKIIVSEINYSGDSVFIKMPVFDAEFRCKILDNRIEGNFHNYARVKFNVLPFHAEMGLSYRFTDKPGRTSNNISGKYHVVFDGEEEDSKDAVGEFVQKGNYLTGTFLTTLGDYRYLEGEVSGNRLKLSAFDGSHLFLFTALIKNDSLVNGEFFSGMHWHDTWQAVKDENAKLIPPDSLAFLKPGYEKLAFTFPDEDGKIISLSNPQFKDKAMIIQLMGSWCPNCMDETKFLSSWYNSRKEKNIGVVALDFERILVKETVSNNIKRLITQFNIQYPVLFAGTSDKKIAAESLPMLNRIFAWPTLIFLDKDKKVIKIHSGFSGPATGKEYTKFINWFERTVEALNKN